MPLTVIDQTPALIVVDLQRGTLAAVPDSLVMPVVDRAAALAARFRERSLPVALVTVEGRAPGRTDLAGTQGSSPRPSDWAQPMPQLGSEPGDIRITKQRWGAFHETGLHEALRERGVTQVFVCGVATGMGVESTARAAHEHGYHVVLVTDAMLDPDEQRHDRSVRTVFPALGETSTTDEVLARL